jgi:hypothetical protein
MRNAAYTYIPEEARSKIPKLYVTERESDPTCQLKLFTPDSNWTWYLIEWDGDDLCFGFVVGHDQELGYFSLADIGEVRGGLGLPVERDLYFTPCRLSEVRRQHA